MTDRDLLESMSKQMGELVRNVAEVRRSNNRLETEFNGMKADITTMKSDIRSLQEDVVGIKSEISEMKTDIHELRNGLARTNARIDERSEFLSTKIDHFVEFVCAEITKNRIAIEEQSHLRSASERRIDRRFDAIERRLDELEAAGAPSRT